MAESRPSERASIPSTGDETPSNWWNRVRYGAYAPVYDLFARPFESGRRYAIEWVDPHPDDRILVLGCGTGRALEHLPAGASITAIDVSEAMVRRTRSRAESLGLDVDVRVGDAQSLPFEDGSFDVILLHLIVSVVPEPKALVAEAARVLAPDGRISIYDKFVAEGERPSLVRRAANPVARLLFADLNRRLEPLAADAGIEFEGRDSFLGGLYTVTVARPAGSGE
ncbi:class I SAM-dependent methyltransferase [Halomicrobium salinisoli]|uniref:class I SAM-dependent methyltransferase n=1 Tax=Halomicrobium salinisoli TaxID=2878391 RepID=UPI001CF08512|nr:class I SAM-dependent methyltransferase [Halomicrobium salinisoli]